MIVYRRDSRRIDPRAALRSLAQQVDRWRTDPPDHDAVTAALIDFGMIEAAVADAIAPEQDAIHPLARAMRQVARLTGHVFWHSCHGDAERLALWSASLRCELRDLLTQALPEQAQTTIPEGYAWYAIHPESYLRAALDFVRTERPDSAVCLGIRSIGTGLSAVVEAALRESGIDAASYTVRPRGHPFDRRPRLAPGLARTLAAWPQRFHLIVDEGPGISGSSMAGTAQCLIQLGVPEERIVFLPSWYTDGRHLRSELARVRWTRHRQYVSHYSPLCAAPRRPGNQGSQCLELSAGQWRPMLIGSCEQFPAVQPQHERVKYLIRDGSHSVLRKFSGLGRFGEPLLERARQLHAAGFTPEPLGLSDGFLATRWVSGVPCTAGDAADPALFDTVIRYLAFLHGECLGQPTINIGSLREMIRTNVAEGLGNEWTERLERQPIFRSPPASDRVTAIDGRMMPHEWIRSGGRYVKSDALDHHADHFMPGCQDIAWDLAGFAVEFRLSRGARYALTRRFARTTDRAGATDLTARLRFYTLAYLAFRLGYVTLAMESLGDAAELARFRADAERYADLLKGELGGARAGLWVSR
ncbi:MAG TPA: hypothetical protein VFL95_00995 [Gemmatimonadales bacterium]|nr:hypothetical protein [Gemmatimonadales bacterium]